MCTVHDAAFFAESLFNIRRNISFKNECVLIASTENSTTFFAKLFLKPENVCTAAIKKVVGTKVEDNFKIINSNSWPSLVGQLIYILNIPPRHSRIPQVEVNMGLSTWSGTARDAARFATFFSLSVCNLNCTPTQSRTTSAYFARCDQFLIWVDVTDRYSIVASTILDSPILSMHEDFGTLSNGDYKWENSDVFTKILILLCKTVIQTCTKSIKIARSQTDIMPP